MDKNNVYKKSDDKKLLFSFNETLGEEEVGIVPSFSEAINANVTNCNSSVGGSAMSGWDVQGPVENSSLFSLSINGIKVNVDMTVQANCNMYFESSTNRTNVGIEFTINGTRQNIMGASDYIRNLNGHNESSTSITQILELTAGDTVGIIMYKLAKSGTVSAPSGKSNLSLKVIK